MKYKYFIVYQIEIYYPTTKYLRNCELELDFRLDSIDTIKKAESMIGPHPPHPVTILNYKLF